MDAYDIFKKLTKGAKFSKKYNKPEKLDEKKHTNDLKVDKEETVTIDKTQEEKFHHEDFSVAFFSDSKNTERRAKKRKLENPDHNERKIKLLKEEEVNHYRNLNNISVVGRHVPEPAKAFDDFKVDADIIENLNKCGYEEPTPIQKQAVPLLLEKRQVLACAPTGSGKTAAFLVPIIQTLGGPQRQGFRALILCPTRELAKQTQRECVKLSEGRGFRVHVISKIKKALTQYGPKSSQKFDILITTPNRVCFLLKQDPPALLLKNIEWLIIDEADKLFESGNRSFRDQLNEVLAACNGEDRKIAMFSATYTPVVAKWCVHNMKGLVRVTVGQRNTATNLVDQELLFVGNEQGKLIAFRDLVRKGLCPPVLVFVQSKDRAQQLFNELIYDGINVDAIHADRTQLQRDNTVRSFREGHIWVLICTELMARGVDFKGVNLIINYDFPPSAISYVHRVGRAGRAGRKGKAITFFTVEDTVNLRSIAHVLKESGCEVPSYMFTMKKKSRSERKQLEKRAPKREDITTKPLYERLKGGKKRKFREINARQRQLVKDTGKKSKPKDKRNMKKLMKSKGHVSKKENLKKSAKDKSVKKTKKK